MIELFEHNQSAYENARALLAVSNRAAIIHATGTGKSFIGFKFCEDNPEKKICWLSPSKYIYNTQLENIKKAANGWQPQNIVFFTYAKLMLLSSDEIADIHPDLIILDEFHRCGADMWGIGLHNLISLYSNVPVLGLSATAIRYLDDHRDMAEELFNGEIASELSLAEAIVRGILTPPKYVLAAYNYQDSLDEYSKKISQKRNKANKDQSYQYFKTLRHSLEKADGLDIVFAKHMKKKDGKYIFFCSDNKHTQEMISLAPKWFHLVDPAPHIYSAYSESPATSKAYRDFIQDESDHLKALFCINMYNEGIHIPGLAGAVFLRGTKSPTIYLQQAGRVFSASANNDSVIFDVVLNIDNLSEIYSLADEVDYYVDYYRKTGRNDLVVNSRFEITDELKDCRVLFKKLTESLSLQWDAMYEVAVNYYKQFGTINISSKTKTAEGYHLGSWLDAQRQLRRKGAMALTPERIAKLDELDMRWTLSIEDNWDSVSTALQEYHDTFGNIDVPFSYINSNDLELGQYVFLIRKTRKTNPDFWDNEKIEFLDNLGMIWQKVNGPTVKKLHYLSVYYEENGNADVPLTYTTKDGFKLGRWLHQQIEQYNDSFGSSMSDDLIQMLKDYGIKLSMEEKRWNDAYQKAKEYYDEHHNIIITCSYKTSDGFPLGKWVNTQKKEIT